MKHQGKKDGKTQPDPQGGKQGRGHGKVHVSAGPQAFAQGSAREYQGAENIVDQHQKKGQALGLGLQSIKSSSTGVAAKTRAFQPMAKNRVIFVSLWK